MLKKLFILLAGALVLAVVFFAIMQGNDVKNQTENKQEEESVLGEESSQINRLNLTVGQSEYSLVWYVVENIENLSLIQNFEEKNSSSKILKSNECKLLTSGGFYSEESKPIGYFVSGGETISKYQSNSLLNGIFSVNYFDTPRITRNVPNDPIDNAVQSGPILIENGSSSSLSLVRDQNARRVMAGITGGNQLIFMVVYDPKSVYLGPKLVEMKDVLENFEKETGIIFADVVNLDGGTASTFYINNGENSASQKPFELTELSPVGAFFCLN